MNRLQLDKFKQTLSKVLNEYSQQSAPIKTNSGKSASGTPEDTNGSSPPVQKPSSSKPINRNSSTKTTTSPGTSSGKGASGTPDDV